MIDFAAIPWWGWVLMVVFIISVADSIAAIIAVIGVGILLAVLSLALFITLPVAVVAIIGYVIVKMIQRLLR